MGEGMELEHSGFSVGRQAYTREYYRFQEDHIEVSAIFANFKFCATK
jgi:hypothetical protein